LLCLLCGFAAAETAEDPASVTSLDFGGRWLDINYIMDEIAKYPNLERVDMYGTPVGIINMGKLTERFPDITFGWTIRFATHATRSDAIVWSTGHNSTSERHPTRRIALLRYCKQLKALNVAYNNCEDLSFVSGMDDLRVLVVSDNLFTDVSSLAGRTKLEYLDLSGNKITDIAPLTGLTHLLVLNLSDNDIEDLTPLTKMTWLKQLWLYRATGRNSKGQPSEETVQMLKEALPDTDIHFTGKPDWKTDPYCKVMNKMFGSKKEYIPFENSWPEE
jgi:hypothetical protein